MQTVVERSGARPDLHVVETTTFEEVYRRHFDRMVRVAYTLTGSNETAEDVVQDAYVKLYGRFDDVGDATPYLYRMVVNGCRERHRHQKVVLRFQHLFAAGPVDPSEADEMMAALARLAPRRRAAVVLRYYADLPLSQIAEVLDCKVGTLKSTLHRALNDLRGGDRTVTDVTEPTFSPRELELQRRLGTVARQATVDAGTWDRLQDRIARDEPTSTATTRRLSRRVVAVAATVLLVVVIASLELREDKGRVDTVDDSTSTTVDSGRSSTTTTSTTTPVELPPGAQPADVAIGGAGGAGAAPSPSGDGDPASPGAGTSTPSGPPGPGTSPTTSPSSNAAPDGRVPAIVYPLLVNNRTVSVAATVWEDESSFHMNVWQTDPWSLYTTWTWGKVAGQNCFAGGTGTLRFGESRLERFSWGLVRADAARVSVLTGNDYEGDGDERLGPEVLPGLRPWLARSTADATRFRAFDAADWTLHYAGPPTWDARPDTC